ncbi:MAG: toprim domain-containing protein [Eubacteriales bacterium]
MKKLKISLPIVVEGKYDKHRLSSILDAHIITTDGFGIFREDEKRALIRRLAANGGVIVMTDSDGAGLVIRNYLRSVLPADSVRHVYIPQVEGKERRKHMTSKEGLIGVEGTDTDILIRLLEPFAEGICETESRQSALTKADFYADGLSGRDDSAQRRTAFATSVGLPKNLSANALLEAVNMLRLYDEYKFFLKNNTI